MSIIKVNKISADSDNKFRIRMPSSAHLNIRGGFAIDDEDANLFAADSAVTKLFMLAFDA